MRFILCPGIIQEEKFFSLTFFSRKDIAEIGGRDPCGAVSGGETELGLDQRFSRPVRPSGTPYLFQKIYAFS